MSVAVNEKNSTQEVVAIIDQTVSSIPSLGIVRREARDVFEKMGLPETRAEEYRHTPITRLLQKNFNLETPSALSQEFNPQEFFIPSLEGNVIVLINGLYSRAHSIIVSPPDEVQITDLGEAMASGDANALKHHAQYSDYRTDSLVAWNTSAWEHGVFVNVPPQTQVKKPILIYNIHDTRAGQVITTCRNLFVVGGGSEVTIIEKFDSLGTSNHFSNTVTEAVVGEGAGMELYSVQNDKGNRFQFAATYIHQANSSRVNTFTFTLNGKLVRNNLTLALDGEAIESHMFGLYLINGDTVADNHTVVDHRKPNSFSNEIYKGIMDGNSRGVFNGKIYVRPHAQKTNAFQANRNILLSEKATVNTKPQLEIWADDVKCSHGCTTGQLDEEALFYLQTRGIQKETARAMMLYAFAVEILNNVKNAALKTYFDQLVSERLHKNF